MRSSASRSGGRRLRAPHTLRRVLLGGGWLTTALGLFLPGIPWAHAPPWALTWGAPPAPIELRLPDLRTLEPSDLRLEVRRDGTRRIRLANTIWNAGDGPLELRGEPDRAAGKMRVFQVLYTADGTTSERPAGEFAWHPNHAHWHLEDFAVYQLWSLTAAGELDRVVADGGKVSYCLIDTERVDTRRPGFEAARGFRGCGRLRQGLSIGWGDHYHAGLDGQDLELGDLPDGLYALLSSANPRGLLLEADRDNNAATIYLGLYGRRLIVVDPRAVAREACLSHGAC